MDLDGRPGTSSGSSPGIRPGQSAATCFAAVVLLLGCARNDARAGSSGTAGAAGSGASAPSAAVASSSASATTGAPSAAASKVARGASASAFGRPIDTTTTTSLVDIAKAPASYRGKVIATEGTVTRVCQERGCWMAIKDDSGTATVRMHGHSFFVPTTSSGKHARVQGTVVLMKDGHECDEAEALGAKLELDATGVELM